MASRTARLRAKTNPNSSVSAAPQRRNPNRGGGGGGQSRKPPRRTGGGIQANGQGATQEDFWAKENPYESYIAELTGLGRNPYDGTDYGEWLKTDAYEQYESAYGTALKGNPRLTRSKFNRNYFANNPYATSMEAYRPVHIQNNPRDYYFQQAQAQGYTPGGASRWEQWLGGQGQDLALSQYGGQLTQNPSLLFMNWLQPSMFQHP